MPPPPPRPDRTCSSSSPTTLGWGDLSCYGNTVFKTPNLDRLAAQGTLFKQFYVAGSVCSPSRAGFLTGQHPARHRIHGHYATKALNEARGMSDFLDPQVPNVARTFRSAGYATAHIGKSIEDRIIG